MKQIPILLILLLLAGCSANGLAIRYFYGEFDDNLYDRIVAYATFSEEQKKQIKQAVDEYTIWHKKSELPRYVAFLDELTTQLKNGEITNQIVLDYVNQARNFARTGFEHSPVFKHPEFFETLSEQQVTEIQDYFIERDKEFEKWYQERQTKGDDARLKRIVKNTRRAAGINLNQEQQQIIRKGLTEIKGGPLQRHEIYNRWQAEFIEILQQRKESSFIAKIKNHLSVYQDQIRLADLEQYQHNQQIVAQLVTDIIVSLDNKQKRNLADRLQTTRETLLSLSAG